MRYLKTFESFNINETMDMMFMPVDPIAGAADVYSDIWNSMKEYAKKGVDFLEGLSEKASELLDKLIGYLKMPFEDILKKIEQFFGVTTSSDLTFKLIFDTLSKKYPADKLVKESREEITSHNKSAKEEAMKKHMDEETTKSVEQKVLSILQYIFGINAFGGTMTALGIWISECFIGFDVIEWAQSTGIELVQTALNPGDWGYMIVTMVYSVVAILILHLIKKLDAWIVTKPTGYWSDGREMYN